MRRAPYDASAPDFFLDVDTGTLYTPKQAPLAGSPRILSIATNQIQFSNNTAEQTYASHTIPGSNVLANGIGFGMGANGVLVLDAWGEFLNNTVGAANWTARLKLGATTLQREVFAIANSAVSHRGWHFQAMIWNRANTAAQVQLSKLTIGVPGAPAGGGGGSWVGAGTTGIYFGGAAGTLDTTADQTLALTFQHGTLSASIQTICELSMVTLHRSS